MLFRHALPGTVPSFRVYQPLHGSQGDERSSLSTEAILSPTVQSSSEVRDGGVLSGQLAPSSTHLSVGKNLNDQTILPSPTYGLGSSVDVEQRSVCATLAIFERSCAIHRVEDFNFGTQALKRTPRDSCLLPAFTTVALTNWSNRHKSPLIKAQDGIQYGHAIESLNAALRDPQKCLEDDTLIAVWFLHIKEVRSYFL